MCRPVLATEFRESFYKQAMQSLNHMLVGAFDKEKGEETPLMPSSVHTVHCSL